MNLIARLEFDLAYYDSEVQRFRHNTTKNIVGHWISNEIPAKTKSTNTVIIKISRRC